MKSSLLFFAGLVASVAFTGCGPARDPGSVSGTIETDEARVASRYGGRVERILVREGTALTAGQVIVELDAAELHARRGQIAAQLAEAQAGPRREEIASARADWEAQGAQLNLARADWKRTEELFSSKIISETERDRMRASAEVMEKSVAAAKARLDLLLAGTRPERIAQAQAQLDELDAQLREMKIVVPTNCVLEVLGVKAGDVVSPNQPVATVLFSGHLWVRVFVPEPWLGNVQVGDAVKLRVDSFPGRDFSGAVEQVQRNAEFTPRNVQTVGDRVKQVFGVKVRVENAEGRLRAGMSADVVFPKVPR